MSTGTLVDLFSGCGGFSLGAELAGFTSLAAVDIDPSLQSGYRRNFPKTRTVQANVADLSRSDWSQILGSGVRPDGIIGGPPCQGFSSIGKRRISDPRNSLVFEFVRHIGLLRPRFFIMENVEGILRPDALELLNNALEELPNCYTVLPPQIISAEAVGAATTRKRVVVFGYDASVFPPIVQADFAFRPKTFHNTVRDAIADLPDPVAKAKGSLGWAPYPEGRRVSPYASAARAPPPAHLGTKLTHEMFEAAQVSGLFETVHSEAIAARYLTIEASKSDPITKSYKLAWTGQCPTLRAGTGAERGAFQAVRPLHPEQGRVITVREAARLQGFPDWFQFHPTKWQSFRMIGNSVSPYLSHALLAVLASKLRPKLAA